MATNGEATERVLVTGASGYLASHIVQQLQEAGFSVRGSVRNLEDDNKVKHLKTLCPEAAHEVELVKAELQDAESWKSAVEGCTYVIHAASPFPFSQPSNEDDLIKPAVEGVTNILKACVEAKTVKRVLMTSAGLAIVGVLRGGEVTEKDWPETDNLDPYAKSKTLAEKAAWDFVKELKDEEKFEFGVLNPVMMLGPILHNTKCTSIELIKRLLERNPMFLPKMNLPMIDVRDAATAHVKALKIKEVNGNRHILCSENMWWSEMAAVLSAEFKSQGYNPPNIRIPRFTIKMASYFKKDAKAVLPIWNKVTAFDTTRMKEVLEITEPRDMKTSIIEMAYSIIEAGFAKKSKKYRGPHGNEEAVVNGPTENGEVKDEDTPKEDGEAVTARGEGKEVGKEGEESAAAVEDAKTEADKTKDEEAVEAKEDTAEVKDAAEGKDAAVPAAVVSDDKKEEVPAATDGENKTDEVKEAESQEKEEDEKKDDTSKENGVADDVDESPKKEVKEVNGEVDASGDAEVAQ